MPQDASTARFDAALFETKLFEALGGDAGLKAITKIEFELLEGGNGAYRWILWEGSKRLFAVTGHPDDTAGYLRASHVLLDAMAGIEPSDDEEHYLPE